MTVSCHTFTFLSEVFSGSDITGRFSGGFGDQKPGLPIFFYEDLVLASFVPQSTNNQGFIGIMFDVFKIKTSRTP